MSVFHKVSKSGKTSRSYKEYFHQHFKLPQHNSMDEWRLTLIDNADNRKELGRREFLAV